MSYIQKQLGGKLRGLKFNQGALMLVQEMSKENYNSYSMYAIVWAGLKMNVFVKTEGKEELGETIIEDGKEKFVPITFAEVCDWVDELEIAEQLEISKVFTSIKIIRDNQSNGESDDKKKELITEPIVIESVAEN